MGSLRKYIFWIILFFPLVVLSKSNTREPILVRMTLGGLYHYKPLNNYGLPSYIHKNKIGFGSTIAIGFNTKVFSKYEFRNYIELNHIYFSANVDYLGRFSANRFYLTISPFQYFKTIYSKSNGNVLLEIGPSFGYNLYSKYQYHFLGTERTSAKRNEENRIVGVNIGLSLFKNYFKRDVEAGIKCRFSPIIGSIEAEDNYISLEYCLTWKF